MIQRISGISAVGSLALAAIVAGTAAAYGCGDESPEEPSTPDAPPVATYTHYVTSTLDATHADDNALNIDGTGPKNAIGNILFGLGSLLHLDVDGSLNDTLTTGKLVLLHSVKSTSLTTASNVTWQVYLGDPTTTPPDLTGGTSSFTISTSSPTNALVTGSLTGGTFTGGPGTITIQLAIIDGQPPLNLTLRNAQIVADVTAANCSGKLGGGISLDDLTTEIIPALAAVLNSLIAADGNCQNDINACDATDKAILEQLDKPPLGNGDNQVSAQEILTNPVISTFLMADIDILDASGNPGKDGVLDSLSVGIGFTCVKGTFAASTEH